MPAQAGIQFPCPRLLDSRLRGNDARIQVLAVYLRNGHLGVVEVQRFAAQCCSDEPRHNLLTREPREESAAAQALRYPQ